MRIIWFFTTPAQLRKVTLILLLIWLAITIAYQQDVFGSAKSAVTDTVERVVPKQNPVSSWNGADQ